MAGGIAKGRTTLVNNKRILPDAQRLAKIGNWMRGGATGEFPCLEEFCRILDHDPQQPMPRQVYNDTATTESRARIEAALAAKLDEHAGELELEHAQLQLFSMIHFGQPAVIRRNVP